MGDKVLTGKSHIPTPTKAIHVSNSNSLIGNVKGHYDFVFNTFKRVEFIAQNEWWWTLSCEYADVVFAVDSWAEFQYPDMTISVTNPFLYVFPTTKISRIHDTRSDMEVAAGIGKALGKLTDDPRYEKYWHFIENGGVRPYIHFRSFQRDARFSDCRLGEKSRSGSTSDYPNPHLSKSGCMGTRL
jgi:nitrate reductase alpha subunit